MTKVLVLGKIHEAGLDRLRQAGGFEIVERGDNPPDLLAQAKDTDAIIVRTTKIGRELLAAAPRLALVARHGVGYDAVDVPALSERGVPLALVGDVNSLAVAEHTLALMLAVVKRVAAYDAAMRAGNFAIRDSFSARELNGRSVLVIGFGRIGRHVARLCAAFGMTVRAADPFVDAAAMAALGVGHVADYRDGLAAADIVSIHAPKAPGGGALIGRAELDAMKPGAILINVARGGMVDEAALADAVEAGRVMAGLDVFDREPLPADDRLAQLDGIVLSPHSAAFTEECAARMSLACADNVIAQRESRLDAALVVNKDVLGAREARS